MIPALPISRLLFGYYEVTVYEGLSVLSELLQVSAWVLLLYGVASKVTQELKLSDGSKVSGLSELFRPGDILTEGQSALQNDDQENALLKSYYRQVLNQSSISFAFSLIFSALGFAVIIFSLLRFEPAADSEAPTAWANLVAGLIIEAVSALIFVQTNNARKTMIDFSEKIRLDRRLDEALELIETMEDKAIQSKVKATLVLLFSGLSVEKDALKEVLMQIIEVKPKTLPTTEMPTVESDNQNAV